MQDEATRNPYFMLVAATLEVDFVFFLLLTQ